MNISSTSMLHKIDLLNEIGIALSAEKNFSNLLEKILHGAKQITHADGGTVYLLVGDRKLNMVIVQTDSLGIHLGGKADKPISFKPIELYHDNGTKNCNMVVTCAVHEDAPINIHDAYSADEYDFSGTYDFDENTGYRSQSFLAVPMKNHENDIIGVLQLINAQTEDGKKIIPFGREEQKLVESLASQAAVAITNKQLIDGLNELFNSLVRLIATAIDEKSPYTSGHCKRLPEITMLLAEAAHETTEGSLKNFSMTDEDRYELEVAAWLHDCGKITTPEYVMDKSTKLEKIFDRIAIVDMRLEVMKREVEIEKLNSLAKGGDASVIEKIYHNKLDKLAEASQVIHCHNKGSEHMSDAAISKIKACAKLEWTNSAGEKQSLLTQDELDNLCIIRGTLTGKERKIINHHIVATIKMLDTLPFPKHLKNVPEYACGHHERMDGNGYPKGLMKEEMSVQARIMAIADIFEALTARDRPYKDPMKLSHAVSILKNMSETGHIDPDLFEVFLKKWVHTRYGNKYLLSEQNDM